MRHPVVRTTLAAFALAALTARASAGVPMPCGDFIGPERYAMPGYPSATIVADFNSDGSPDIATASESRISVLLGALGSAPQPPIVTDVDFDPASLVAGDFDEDGKADLIAATAGSPMFFLHGNGDGTFAAPVFVDYTGSPSALVAIDVDHDSSLDLVTAGSQDPGLVVFLGNGDGTFGPGISTLLHADVNSLALGILNGDAYPDAIVASYGSESLVFLPGIGNGTFGPPTVLVSDAPRSGVILGDFDGDGNTDIGAVTSSTFLVTVLPGHGDGTFGAEVSSPAGPAPRHLTAADLDGDGLLDLVVVQTNDISASAGGLLVLLGRGDGTFDTGEAYASGPGGGGTTAAAADFDGDGHVDVVLVPGAFPEEWVLFGRGDGSLRATPYALFGQPAALIASGDFNEDGKSDLATANTLNGLGLARVALAVPGNRFGPSSDYPLNGSLSSIATGDFHDTGHLDLVFILQTNTSTSIAVLPGHGDGTFGSFEIGAFPGPSAYAYPLVPGRFDADGELDLAVTTFDPLTQIGSVSILPGNGHGAFSAGPQTRLPNPPVGLAAADFDGDGKLDLAVTAVSAQGGRLYVLNGAGDGTFSISTPYTAGGYSVFFGDVNEDGALDILTTDAFSAVIGILLGHGDGTFAAPYFVGVGWPASSGLAADVNGDGHLDLITGRSDNRVSLLLGFGDGAFVAPSTTVVGVYSGPIASGDFNGDGLADVGAADDYPFEGGVAVLWSSRTGEVTVPPTASVLVGSTVSISAAGGGLAAESYQWRRDGAPLADGGAISGARTATLTIDPAAFADAGIYDVLVTDACATAASNPTMVSVEFADVPVSNIFHADIITIATSGITAGCGGANYCPSALVNRAQMAVFLLKSEHGSAYAPPACTGLFADVPCPSTYANWIEQLSNEGVTAGCGGADYCPDASVTRAQMAVFLLKTSQGSSYVPPAATAIFDDVPVGAFADAFIDDLYNRGIAGGCSTSPLLYCPNNVVNRAQMAAFLVNTFF